MATTTTRAWDNESEDGAWNNPCCCRICCHIGRRRIKTTEEVEDDVIPPLSSHHRSGAGDSNPVLALLTWMSFTTLVPLTVGVVPGCLNRHDIYLEDAAIPSRFTSLG